MANKDELAVGIRVGLKAEDGKTYFGTTTRFLPGGKCEVKFDDGELSSYEYDDLIVVVPEEGDDSPEEPVNETAPEIETSEPAETDEPDDEETITMTQTVTIPKSRVVLDSKSMANPVLLAKEEAKQARLAAARKKVRVAKMKAKPKTPVQVRKGILTARLRKVKNRRPHTYRKEQIIVWAKELEIIKNRPDSWSPGCVRAKKKKSAQDFIDELQID